MNKLIKLIKQFMGQCPNCKGAGTLPDGSTCGDCWGSGND